MKISKSLIQYCERSELCLYFEWTKVNQKYQKWSILASFGKTKACGQKVLPDRSVFIGQKLVENAKFQKFKCDILSNFQTMCILQKIEKVFELFASILTFQFSKKCEYHQRKVPHHDPLWHITDLPRNYLRRS